MLYYLFGYLERQYDLFGAGVFRFLSFRAIAAISTSLLIGAVYGRRLITYLRVKQVGESVRDLGLEGQMQKKGTPTMGGFIIIASLLIPVLLFARITNVYIVLLVVSTVWMGLIGFVDDYLKIKAKKLKQQQGEAYQKSDRDGLAGRFKIVGQVGLGLIVGLVLYFNPHVKVREYGYENYQGYEYAEEGRNYTDVKALTTTVPFLKNNELDYADLTPSWLPPWLPYVLIVTFIITAVSNGANITDGIDGLAAGTSAIIVFTLGIFAYLSGNTIFAQYLNIMYLPNSGELVVFCAAFTGACIGFLWYNSFPAQIFMGDTGSLMLGGVIAVLALAVRKELLIPVLCGIFLVENLSVILQVSYFKYQKKRRGLAYAQQHRLFLMSPLHHHFQKKGYHEAKIVTRFWIISIMLAVVCLATLKLR